MLCRLTRSLLPLVFGLTSVPLLAPSLTAGEFKFRTQELPTKLTVGYAVRLADINEDGKQDIVVVDSDRIVWLENPTWKEREVAKGKTKKDNVCIAIADIDGDGHLDFAVGADWRPFDTKTGGTIQWMKRGKTLDDPWTVHFIAEEPTVHRMHFADLDGDKKPELIVSPLMGKGTTKPDFAEAPVRQLIFKIPKDPVSDRWPMGVLNETMHVTHNFWPCDLNGDSFTDFLWVSFEGVHYVEPVEGGDKVTGKWTITKIGEGDQKSKPNRGASEIKLGSLAKATPYIGTIEPWHGDKVVVYTKPAGAELRGMWNRQVLDEKLKWGHALTCVNLDDDPAEELVIGIRDNLDKSNQFGVRIYDPQDTAGSMWTRTVLDPGGVAVEDLTAGDLNGDGRAEIIAVGRATKNIRIYWNEPKK